MYIISKILVEDENDPYNILLVQPCDIRHILKTISERRRLDKNYSINFYIYDKPIEVLTKELLLLNISCDWELSIRNRVNTFLEIYGNNSIQERTEKYVMDKGKELIKLVCDKIGFLNDIVDFSLMKFKDRDEIEETLKSWDMKIKCDVYY